MKERAFSKMALRTFGKCIAQSSSSRSYAVSSLPGWYWGRRLLVSSAGPRLRVSPEVGMADEALDVTASGLAAGTAVVLRARVDSECGRFRFESQARYAADIRGEISVASQPSLGGTYHGVAPTGLLWSVQPIDNDPAKIPRLIKLKPTQPFVYTFTMSREDDVGGLAANQGEVLDSVVVERHYVAPYVEPVEVECGSAKGTLYLPKQDPAGGSGRLPVIIEMLGLGPGAALDRPSLLASHGFAVFHFNYFDSLKDGLAAGRVVHLDCQLLHNIIDFVRDHTQLDENKIGINGSCYGACLALNAVARTSDLPIRCLVAQRSADCLITEVGMKLTDGTVIDPLTPIESYTYTTTGPDGKEWFHFDSNHSIFQVDCTEPCVAPVENISVPMMLLMCEDDQQCPPVCLKRVASRVQAGGQGQLLEVHRLERAGHLLESPNLPLCTQSRIFMPSFKKPLYVRWGGSPVHHARAQVTAWRKVINFFRRHLRPEVMRRTDWLDAD